MESDKPVSCPKCQSPFLIVEGMKLTCGCGFKIDLYELQRENEELKRGNAKLQEKLRLMEH